MQQRRDTGGVRIRPSWIWAAGLSLITLLVLGVPLGSLVYLAILLVCPLAMLLMHGTGHGHHHEHGAQDREAPIRKPFRGSRARPLDGDDYP